MAADLALPTQVIPCPTVREPDGLALSSRNIHLDDAQRTAARSISRGLFAAAMAMTAGERSGRELEHIVASTVRAEPGIELDYAVLADRDTAESLDCLDRPAFLAVAATAGATRLLDNVHVDRIEGEWVPDVGVRLDTRSILYKET
jgi:pantoate--beta-alanine ligase